MKYLQEVTDWGTSQVQNHTYYLNDSKTKMVGYIKSGTNSFFKFSKPLSFSSKGRKFVEVKNFQAEKDEVYFGNSDESSNHSKPTSAIEVKGAGGKVYYLTKNSAGQYSCSCLGFSFRRTCKHLQEALGQ